MKNGIIIENGVPTYYENDVPVHRGIVKDGDDIYYFGKDGKAVTGEKYIHTTMTNHVVKHGTYKFGRNYKMKKGYYRPAGKSRPAHGKRPDKTSGKKVKNSIALIVISVALVLLLAGVFTYIAILDGTPVSTDTETTGETRSATALYVNVPEIEGDVWLVTDDAKAYYTGEAELSAVIKANPYKPFRFNYSIVSFDKENRDKIQATLYLSEDPSMANARSYDADPWAETLAVDNLKVDTTYYYRFIVTMEEKKQEFDGSFKTAATHRFLYLPNVRNIRDVGGRKTADGKTVRQNMIIRGSELDGLVQNDRYLLDEYVDYARELFGFKSDLDLRQKSIGYINYASRLGDDVQHSFFTAPGYAGIMSDLYRDTLKSIFSFLADSSNYPIYMHCSYGVDRTGTMVYLLDAILGLSEEEMTTEYTLSYTDPENLSPMRAALEPYDGDTVNEKVESFLIESIGVTPEEIASIRSIMLAD